MKYLYERMREHLDIIGTTKILDFNGMQRNSATRILGIARNIVAKGLLKSEAMEEITTSLENHIIALEQDARLPEDEYSYRIGFDEGFTMAHEPAGCGHARANWKDPNFGTPEYDGREECEFCSALAALEPRTDK